MKTKLFFAIILSISLVSGLYAQTQETDTTVYALLDIITLLMFLLAVLSAFQLYIYMKGGTLVSSWRWLTGATIFLAITKILELSKASGVFPVSTWLFKIIYLVAAIFLAAGFYEQKKILS